MTAFRNLIPGDQTSEVVATLLVDRERVVKANADSVRGKMKKLKSELDKLEDELQAIQAVCTHHVFEDTAGFPYDIRHCHLCGKHLGHV